MFAALFKFQLTAATWRDSREQSSQQVYLVSWRLLLLYRDDVMPSREESSSAKLDAAVEAARPWRLLERPSLLVSARPSRLWTRNKLAPLLSRIREEVI